MSVIVQDEKLCDHNYCVNGALHKFSMVACKQWNTYRWSVNSEILTVPRALEMKMSHLIDDKIQCHVAIIWDKCIY